MLTKLDSLRYTHTTSCCPPSFGLGDSRIIEYHESRSRLSSPPVSSRVRTVERCVYYTCSLESMQENEILLLRRTARCEVDGRVFPRYTVPFFPFGRLNRGDNATQNQSSTECKGETKKRREIASCWDDDTNKSTMSSILHVYLGGETVYRSIFDFSRHFKQSNLGARDECGVLVRAIVDSQKRISGFYNLLTSLMSIHIPLPLSLILIQCTHKKKHAMPWGYIHVSGNMEHIDERPRIPF